MNIGEDGLCFIELSGLIASQRRANSLAVHSYVPEQQEVTLEIRMWAAMIVISHAYPLSDLPVLGTADAVPLWQNRKACPFDSLKRHQDWHFSFLFFINK